MPTATVSRFKNKGGLATDSNGQTIQLLVCNRSPADRNNPIPSNGDTVEYERVENQIAINWRIIKRKSP